MGSGASHETYVPLYQQCGGKAYHGPTKCEPGTGCRKMNDWYGQCVRMEGCVNGWKSAPKCVSEFFYDDDRYVGCKKGKSGKHWCSWDPKYTGRWSYCTPCSKEGGGHSTLVVDVAETSAVGPSEEVLNKHDETMIIMKKDMVLPNGDTVVSKGHGIAMLKPVVVGMFCGFVAVMTLAMAKWRSALWWVRPERLGSMAQVALVDSLAQEPPQPQGEAAESELLGA